MLELARMIDRQLHQSMDTCCEAGGLIALLDEPGMVMQK